MSVLTERFNIETRLAVGCAGLVYRATERQNGFPVALKLLMSPEEIAYPLDVPALLRDAQRLRTLSGAHVAQLLDVIEDEDGGVLVYQFCDGINGATLPSERMVERDEAIDIASQFMTALECVERTRQPHGDLKPSNVIIAKSEDGRPFVLLLDWGLSAYRTEPPPDSLLFMAPERLAGGPPSLRADFFSAAAVLHYLLAGESLVAGADRETLVAAWKNAKPETLKAGRPDLPPKFIEWIARLMELRPDKRPASVAEAKRALAEFHPPPPPAMPRHLIPRPLMMKPQASAAAKIAAPQVPRIIPVAAQTTTHAPPPPTPETATPKFAAKPVASVTEPSPSPKRIRWHPAFSVMLATMLGACIAGGVWFFKNNPLARDTNPAAWSDYDIGSPAVRGGSAFDPKTGIWTVKGGDADVSGSTDQFHFTGGKFNGDGMLVAKVIHIDNTDAGAKSGLMFRDSTAADAAFVQMAVTAGGQMEFQWRADSGGKVASATGKIRLPAWIKLIRVGKFFAGLSSPDGVNWAPLGFRQIPSIHSAAFVGLSVIAPDDAELTTTTFTNVSILGGGWNDADIGAPALPGGAFFNPENKTWAIRGGGTDIWGKADQFHFVSRNVADQSILVKVVSMENTDPWAKAGIMFRASPTPGAAHVALFATPTQGLSIQWRRTTGAVCELRSKPGLAAPIWLKLDRKGNAFTASFSKDGKNWTQLDVPQAVLLPAKIEIGYCVTSHNPTALTTGKFTAEPPK